MTTTEQELREQICQIGQEMHHAQLVDGGAGNISARLDKHRVLITPSGLGKGFMRPDQLIVVDLNGNKVGPETEASRPFKPSTETPMHLEVYQRRPDVNGVVHAHPAYATALTIAGIHMQKFTIPEAIILLGVIPTTGYATPATEEDRDVVARFIDHHDAILLSHHGSLTVGRSVWEAYLRLETLEHTARLTYLVHQLGGGQTLTEEQLHKLLELRRQFGLAHTGEPIPVR